jgi:hypothetical protein
LGPWRRLSLSELPSSEANGQAGGNSGPNLAMSCRIPQPAARFERQHRRWLRSVAIPANRARSGGAVSVGMRGGNGLEQALRCGGDLGHGLVEGVLVRG